MTLLGTAIQAGLSGVLVLAPGAVLKKDRMRISTFLAFLAIFSTCQVGGVILALPASVFLLLFFLWLRFVGHADTGAKPALFIVTLVLSALFLAQNAVHLPIRFALDQPPFKIAANVAGIFLGATMLVGAVELLIIRKRKRKADGSKTVQIGGAAEESDEQPHD